MALSKPWAVILRIILIAVIVFVLLVACVVGHFGSDWTHRDKNLPKKEKMFEQCPNVIIIHKRRTYDCPDIGLERFYLAMLFLCLFWAIGSLLLVLFNKNDNKCLRLVDLILHVVLGFLLLIGVITFLVSTVQVMEYLDARNEALTFSKSNNKEIEREKWEVKSYEEWYQGIIKIIAAILGVIVVALHVLLAVLIGIPLFKELKQGGGGKAEEGAASQSAMQASPSKQEAEAMGQSDPR